MTKPRYQDVPSALIPEIAGRDGAHVRVVAGQVDGDDAAAGPARFLLLSAQPLEEPYARCGPFVMNTPEEIRQALQELREGTFIKQSPGANTDARS
jgi:redox-sensitive bicupin YhaK (pirin superfamily)